MPRRPPRGPRRIIRAGQRLTHPDGTQGSVSYWGPDLAIVKVHHREAYGPGAVFEVEWYTITPQGQPEAHSEQHTLQSLWDQGIVVRTGVVPHPLSEPLRVRVSW